MFRKTVVIMTLSLLFISAGVYAGEKMSHTDEMRVRAANVEQLRFRGIDFAELAYTGENNSRRLEISITYNARVDNKDELEEIIDEYDFDIDKSDDVVTLCLHELKHRSNGVLKRLFRHNERRIILKVSGPSNIDLDIESDFSDVRTEHTRGDININTDFSKVETIDHEGRLTASVEFGNLVAEKLVGSFDLDLEFSQGELTVGYLDFDSRASVEFGEIDIDLPVNTDAEFRVSKSLGDVDFDFSEQMSLHGNRRFTMNNGGYVVNLSAEFGKITVRDTMKRADARPERTRKNRRDSKEACESRPEFKEGIVKSIRIRGTRLLRHDDIEHSFGISAGNSYTRNEIAGKVKELSEKNRFISSANFTIDQDGNLSVRVYEIEPFHKDLDLYGSFSRVGGVGIGPKLTIYSEVGPLSEINGGGQYHFSNDEWTYNVHAEKHVFDANRFAIGGSYRRDYESSMDWTIPPHDSHINAFLLGLETTNYYQVEAATGYVSQTLLDRLQFKAEYFEEEFSSVKKHTNWSLFNHRHKKEDNPSLSPASIGRITGFRYSVNLRSGNAFTNSEIHLEMERTSDANAGTLPAYTRYLGTAVQNIRMSYGHILKLRVASGYSEDMLPDQKSFRLGGVNTLRGYGFGMVPLPDPGTNGFDYQGGGSKMFLANFDYFTGHRGDDMRLVLFGDVGNVWMNGQKVDRNDLKRDLGVGIAFEGDFFRPRRIESNTFRDIFRVNWAVPVGNVPHTSMWTVNFVRAY